MTWCLSCTELNKCPAATADMIIERLGCAKWSETEPGVVEAREEIVMMLGPHSILSKPNPKKLTNEKEYAIMSNDENRSKLRLIAIKSGLLEKIELAKSLRWTEDQLLEKLEGTFEDCRSWDSDKIDEIISDLSSGKKRQPAKAKSPEEAPSASETKEEPPKRQPTKRKRRSKKTTEPVVEKVEAKDLDPNNLTAEGNVKKRKPATRKKRQPVVDGEPQAAVFQVDGKQLIEEFGLADVKDQVVSNQALLAGLTIESEDMKASLEKLDKKLSLIEKFCVWFYSSETEDEISGLSDVFED